MDTFLGPTGSPLRLCDVTFGCSKLERPNHPRGQTLFLTSIYFCLCFRSVIVSASVVSVSNSQPHLPAGTHGPPLGLRRPGPPSVPRRHAPPRALSTPFCISVQLTSRNGPTTGPPPKGQLRRAVQKQLGRVVERVRSLTHRQPVG